MPDNADEELLALNQRLLDSIAGADWAAYEDLCDPTLTALEPESCGHLVHGLEFHHFYFTLGSAPRARHTTMCSPHVRLMGDVAVIAYTRLNQRLGADGQPVTTAVAETRVWQRQAGRWRHVHFHRSPA
jgi:calcium/calmodulin-dependent protein kinase (CaM kinase) II